MLFVEILKGRIGTLTNTLNSESNLPLTFTFMHDQHLVTKGKGSVNVSRLKKENIDSDSDK